MNATNTLKKQGSEKTFDYIYKDPDKNMPKIMDWADKFAEGEFPTQREMIRERSQIQSIHIIILSVICLQPSLHRMLGSRIRSQTESYL